MDEFKIYDGSHPAGMGGEQKLYRFPNGHGASVVRTGFSYGGDEGQWEIAVTRYEGSGRYDFKLDYTTPITEDVIGRQSWEQIEEHLAAIKALPTPQTN